MIAGQLYPPQRVIAVDIDGTLWANGRVNQTLVDWCQAQKRDGFRMMLWSSRGLEYARRFVEQFDLRDLFDDVISKPGYVVDDQGWQWTRYTHVVRPNTLTRGP